jgi:predicted dehydrogenase
MTMTEPLRVGVIGVGSLGQHHARIYSAMGAEVSLVGVHDLNADRAREVAERHGTRAFERVEELAGAIEAASVAVPTDRHLATAGLLMERGVHLLVEKPIARTNDEAREMVRLASDRGLILQVGHVERFNPVMRFLEDNLAAPRFIEAIRLSPYPAPGPGGLPRGTDVSVVLDLMIHDLDIILHLVRSEVGQIHAVGVPVLSASEDIANVRLAFANGCVANVTASRISQERMRKIRVFQEDSYVSLDYMDQSGQLYQKTAAGITRTDVPIDKAEPLAAELAAFVRCVRQRREPVVTGRHASDALSLAMEICRHIRQSPS